MRQVLVLFACLSLWPAASLLAAHGGVLAGRTERAPASATLRPEGQSLMRLARLPEEATAGSASLDGRPVLQVQVQGNLKIEKDAILAAVRTRVGAPLSLIQIRQDVKALYALGLFRDIQVDAAQSAEGVTLTYVVVEKPSIRTVRIDGDDKLEKDDIQEVITLKLFSILNEATMQENALKIKDLYAEKGYFLAEITPEVVPLNENEVEVVFHIKENSKVLVQKIYFVGAEKVSPEDFKRYLQIKEGGFFSFLGSSGTFNQQQLEDDAMLIMAYYNEKGYVQARVENPNAFMSPDKKGIYITYKIHEGDRYKLDKMDVSGEFIGNPDELRALIKARKGDWFGRTALNEDLQRITDYYSDRGYAFANVVPVPEVREDEKVVDITFDVAKGERIGLDNIRIFGNSVTWDKAIRRELLINEGELYRGLAMKEGKRRLERLGYFEEVKIVTPRSEEENTLDMEVEVKEKATGTFNIGAGFSSFESFIFNANIAKQNFMGLGYIMSAAAQISALRQQYSLNFFDPYFFDTRWTFRVDAYNVDTTYQLSEYRRGLSLGLGHYIGLSDDARLSVKYGFESVGLRNISQTWKEYVGGELFRGGDVSSLEASFSLDRRNNRITPTKGYMISASSELAGGFRVSDTTVLSIFGGDFNFHRHQFNFRLYVPLYRKIEDLAVFRLNTTVGGVFSTDGRMLPLLQRYRAGGINSVRGYNILSLGPTLRISSTDEPSRYDTTFVVGGYQIATANLELEFAIIRQAGIRGVVFFDAGNAFDLFGTDSLAEQANGGLLVDQYPRLSTGFGFRWFSPMGPLRFEWGFPLTRREGERKQVFEFTIGSFF